MIRVVLPHHLRVLAGTGKEVGVAVEGEVTVGSVLDALERDYPTLVGTLRDPVSRKRRAFVRFFACEEDLSHQPADELLPDAVVAGKEPFFVVGAMAGG